MTLTWTMRDMMLYQHVSRARMVAAIRQRGQAVSAHEPTVAAGAVAWWSPVAKMSGYCADVTRGEWQ